MFIFKERYEASWRFQNAVSVNEDKIKKYINNNCKLISLPSICIDTNDYNNSINEFKKRELQNQNNIIVTDIIEKYNSTYKLFQYFFYHHQLHM